MLCDEKEKMDQFKHILSSLLVLLLLASGLPLFSPNDANRDSKVDLGDLILDAKDFEQTPEDLTTFQFTAGKLITTIQVVANLKSQIRTRKDPQSGNPSFSNNLNYLLLSSIIPNIDSHYSVSLEDDFKYKSIHLRPETPPPKNQ